MSGQADYLLGEVLNSHQEIFKLKARAEAAEQRLSVLEEENIQWQGSHTALKMDYANVEAQRDEAYRILATTQAIVAENQVERRTLRAERDEARKQREEQREDQREVNQGFGRSLAAVMHERDEARKQVLERVPLEMATRLANERDEAHEEWKQAELDRDSNFEEVKALRKQVESAEAEVTRLEGHQERLVADLDETRAQIVLLCDALTIVAPDTYWPNDDADHEIMIPVTVGEMRQIRAALDKVNHER